MHFLFTSDCAEKEQIFKEMIIGRHIPPASTLEFLVGAVLVTTTGFPGSLTPATGGATVPSSSTCRKSEEFCYTAINLFLLKKGNRRTKLKGQSDLSFCSIQFKIIQSNLNLSLSKLNY